MGTVSRKAWVLASENMREKLCIQETCSNLRKRKHYYSKVPEIYQTGNVMRSKRPDPQGKQSKTGNVTEAAWKRQAARKNQLGRSPEYNITWLASS